MNAVFAVSYLAACFYIAYKAAAGIELIAPDCRPTTIWAVVVAAFSLAFFLGFHFLGYVNLVTGARSVVLQYALVVVLTAAVGFGVATALIGKGASRGFRLSTKAFRCMPRTRLARLLLVCFALAGGMLMFGFPVGYEPMAYHLPNALNIMRSESLRAWDGNFPHTFPLNSSILYAFLLGVLPEKLVSTGQMPLLVPLALGVGGICRLADADRKASELALAGLLTVPLVAFSAVELGADVGGIAFIAMAMYFALADDLSIEVRATLAGACSGLAFGFKSLHLVSTGFLAILFCVQAVGGANSSINRVWPGVRTIALFGGAFLASGGFWLIRNYVDYGNPLHPVNVPLVTDLFGWTKVRDVDYSARHETQFEWVRTSSEWLVYPWVEWHYVNQNFKDSSGLGAFVAAGVPVALGSIAVAVVVNGVRQHLVRLALLLATIFVAAVWWVLDDRQPRYMMAALVYSVPVVAWVTTQAGKHYRRVFDMFLTVCVATMMIVFLSKQTVQFGDRIVYSGYRTRTLYYAYPSEIDTLPKGTRILNLAARTWHYPLAGSQLSNEVISMPEGRRILGLPSSLSPPHAVELHAKPLVSAGVTHLFVEGQELVLDSCVHLTEVGRSDRNPTNGVLLESPRILYRVAFC